MARILRWRYRPLTITDEFIQENSVNLEDLVNRWANVDTLKQWLNMESAALLAAELLLLTIEDGIKERQMAKKMAKATVKKAHSIARKVAKRGGVRNPWAVGTAVAKRSAAKRKRKRSR